MVHLRVARETDREEVPLHFEGVPLKAFVARVGWLAAIVLTFGGVAIMVTTAGSLVELIGALAAAVGGVLVAALLRCRRYEITVGKRWLKARLGPLKHDVPRQLIVGISHRASSGWRRLYADHELVVAVSADDSGSPMPSRDVHELCRELEGAPGTGG